MDEFVSLVAEARDDLDFLVDLVIEASRPWEAWTSSEGPYIFPMNILCVTVSNHFYASGIYCFPNWVKEDKFPLRIKHINRNL